MLKYLFHHLQYVFYHQNKIEIFYYYLEYKFYDFYMSFFFHLMSNNLFIIYYIFKFITSKIRAMTFTNTFSQLLSSIIVYDFGFGDAKS